MSKEKEEISDQEYAIQHSEEEDVQVTVKVPKQSIELLEEQKWFGHNKQSFLSNAINCYISAQLSSMDVTETAKIYQKYGKNTGAYAL